MEKIFLHPSGAAASGIAYNRNHGRLMPATSLVTHDLRWVYDNTTHLDYVGTGARAVLDPDDKTKLLTLNAFGNLERRTNSLGLNTTYDGTGGELVNYGIDHYTGDGIYLDEGAQRNINFEDTYQEIDTLVAAGFSDWRMLTTTDVEAMYTSYDTHLWEDVESWISNSIWLLDSLSATNVLAWNSQNTMYSATYTSFAVTTTTFGICSVAIRKHYT